MLRLCDTRNTRNNRFSCLPLQILTTVVCPGAQPTSEMGRKVASYSGHIMKLVPGDHQYAFPLFSIVITWNGSDTFCPTQPMEPNAVRNWKLGMITRHLSEAMAVFEEVEGDLQTTDERAFADSFLELREHLNMSNQLLGNRLRGQGQNIPPVTYGPKKGTSSDVTYHIPTDYVPQPFTRQNLDPSVLDPQLHEQNMMTDTGEFSQAPTTRGTTVYTTNTCTLNFRPSRSYSTQDFTIPMDLVLDINLPPSQMSQQYRHSQSQITHTQPQPQQIVSLPADVDLSQQDFTFSLPIPATQFVPETQLSQTVHTVPDTQFPVAPQLQPQSSIQVSFPVPPPPPPAIQSSFPVPLQPEVFITQDAPPQPLSARPPLSARQSAPAGPPSDAPVPLAPIFSRPATPAQQATSATPAQQATPSVSGPPAKKYQCLQCTYSTDRKQDFDNHQNMHTGKRFKCSHQGCPKSFASKKNRDFHFKHIHLGINRCICSVDKCNYSCNDYGILAVHEFDEHAIGDEARCQHCQKKFGNYRVFQRHIKTCLQEKDKHCDICNKGYKSTERLVQHIDLQHKGQPKLICEQCGGVFCSDESLRVHHATQHK